MKIESKNCDSYITIEHIGDKYYSSFSIETELSKPSNLDYFKGHNRDVQLLSLDDFINDLDCFIIDRTKKPRLNGTYDFCLEIQALESTRAWLTIYLGYEISIPDFKTIRYGVSGGFEIDIEFLNQMVRGFKDLKNIMPVDSSKHI